MPLARLLETVEDRLHKITAVSKRYPKVAIVAAGGMLALSATSMLGLFTDLTIVQFYDTVPLPPIRIEGKLEWMDLETSGPDRLHLIALWDISLDCKGAQLVQTWRLADGSTTPAIADTSTTGTTDATSILQYPPDVAYEGIFYKTFTPPPAATYLQWVVVASAEECQDERARQQNVGVIKIPPKREYRPRE